MTGIYFFKDGKPFYTFETKELTLNRIHVQVAMSIVKEILKEMLSGTKRT